MTRVAAIDCGTNSIRLLVADVETTDDGVASLIDVHREMRIVRLGEGVDATGRLAEEALERTRVALADYAATIRRLDAERVRMVATSATRDASNRGDFFGMVRATLGAEAEVISGDEEARLSFLGAVSDLDPADGPFLVVDIGGGSTELVLGTWDGRTASVDAARSVDIGCVRITERHLGVSPPSSEAVAAGEEFARATLEPAFDEVPIDKARAWVGVAGTVTTISAIAQGLAEYDATRTHLHRLGREQLHTVAADILGLTPDELAARPVIHPGRRDVIAGGALVLRVLADELLDRAGIDALIVSEHDILDGIAFGLA